MIRPILHAPDRHLGEASRPVGPLDADAAGRLVADLRDTVIHAGGLGLAAPQVGVNLRVVVIGGAIDGPHPRVLINPEIVRRRGGTERALEGCLSLPGVQVRVERARRIVYAWQDRFGGPVHQAKATGLLARVIQHEVDHLDGVLITDRRAGSVV